MRYEFTVFIRGLEPESHSFKKVKVEAMEVDIHDGALAFIGANRGGYVAIFAPGQWLSVTSEPKADLP